MAIGAWFDGAMPRRGETVKAYVLGIHQHWLDEQRQHSNAGPATGATLSHIRIETRFHYNLDIESLPAMVPSVIALLLLMLPAMLTALSVVREKAVGSIINLYVTPVSRAEFLLGKQLPYVALAMLNFAFMCMVAVLVLRVPMKGSLALLSAAAALLYSFATTGMGLLASAVTKSQIAAMFIAALGTLVPATQFSGLITPVSSLEGVGRAIGEIYPATYMVRTSGGVFTKGLGLEHLFDLLLPLLLSIPVIFLAALYLLPKQER
ncbi:Ribosome-associated ATPase [bioreactor metagenome]|uniref:Ribosome-associated ATPase n=1 Tax=bioreactor metagenome TaxID=1076179 RepID=A0A645EZY2_9ZZZZ